MGDFNEVRCIEEQWGSVFNSHGANAFNSFISNSGLNDIQRVKLSIKGIMVDGDWIVEPDLVKQEFRRHFTDRFQDPGSRRGSLNFPFPNCLNNDQILELESPISNEDIRTTVWGCGVDKSPGPDGFTFEFFS
ncbi:hypothetical protein Tco_1170068, partial [Tanacetum coccineum]